MLAICCYIHHAMDSYGACVHAYVCMSLFSRGEHRACGPTQGTFIVCSGLEPMDHHTPPTHTYTHTLQGTRDPFWSVWWLAALRGWRGESGGAVDGRTMGGDDIVPWWDGAGREEGKMMAQGNEDGSGGWGEECSEDDDAEFKAGFSPVHPRDMLGNLWNVSCVPPAKIISCHAPRYLWWLTHWKGPKSGKVLECSLTGFRPDRRAYLSTLQIFPGDSCFSLPSRGHNSPVFLPIYSTFSNFFPFHYLILFLELNSVYNSSCFQSDEK